MYMRKRIIYHTKRKKSFTLTETLHSKKKNQTNKGEIFLYIMLSLCRFFSLHFGVDCLHQIEMSYRIEEKEELLPDNNTLEWFDCSKLRQ